MVTSSLLNITDYWDSHKHCYNLILCILWTRNGITIDTSDVNKATTLKAKAMTFKAKATTLKAKDKV